MRVEWLLVATLFLGGCAEEPTSLAGVDAVTATPTEAATTLNFSADLLLNRLSLHRGTAVGFGLPGDTNCVWLRHVSVVQDFTVTATWDAATPAWERLEMTIQHQEDQEFLAGPSPLTINAQGLARDEFFRGIGTILQPEVPGPVLDQSVHLEIVVTVASSRLDPEAELENSGCVWGRVG